MAESESLAAQPVDVAVAHFLKWGVLKVGRFLEAAHTANHTLQIPADEDFAGMYLLMASIGTAVVYEKYKERLPS